MIKNNLLFKISASIVLVGVFFLLILTNLNNQKITPIIDLNSSLIGKEVIIKGRVNHISNNKNHTIISLEDDSGKINVYVNKKIFIKTNQTILVTGILKEYKENFAKFSKDISAKKIQKAKD
jgi:aspartyl/asparaginyl-tRNA synthetase